MRTPFSRGPITARALGVLVLLHLCATGPVLAAPIDLIGSLGAGGVWGAGDPWVEDNTSPGSLYFDGNSWDSHSTVDAARLGHPVAYNPANVAALLSGSSPTLVGNMAAHLGTPTYTALNAPGTFGYWMDANNQADPSFYFSPVSSVSFTITILAELARRNDVNEFGWYRQSDPNDRTVIFTGADTRGDSWTGVIDGPFGFYYSDPTRGHLYFTESLLPAQTADSGQQFAVFGAGDTFYLGLEDRFGPITPKPCGDSGCSDYDYNDLLVSIDASPIPEPASVLLLGSGLTGVIALTRRLRRHRR